MKKYNFKILLLLNCLFALVSCSDDEPKNTQMVTTDMFYVHMFVTNNEGEDLVLVSKDNIQSGNYTNQFRFDTWNVYLDGKLIQSASDNSKYQYKSTSSYKNGNTIRRSISLDTDCMLQNKLDDWEKRHVVEYIVTSASLFGDTEAHTIRMEFQGKENKEEKTFIVQYSIAFDGMKQEVFYPDSWDGLFPKSEDYGDYIHYPYFVLNVDDL